MRTLLLDQEEWDLVLDIAGNIAVAGAPYAIAQDVASEIRVFAGELYYNIALGIPYLQAIVGNTPSLQYLRSEVERAALRVPEVRYARCIFVSLEQRVLTGQVQIIDKTGVTNNVSF